MVRFCQSQRSHLGHWKPAEPHRVKRPAPCSIGWEVHRVCLWMAATTSQHLHKGTCSSLLITRRSTEASGLRAFPHCSSTPIVATSLAASLSLFLFITHYAQWNSSLAYSVATARSVFSQRPVVGAPAVVARLAVSALQHLELHLPLLGLVQIAQRQELEVFAVARVRLQQLAL